MDWMDDKQGTVTRIAICAVAAFLLYTALEKLGDDEKLPMIGQYMPWIKENKVQAIAIAGAVLYGVSLAVWPLEEKKPLPGEGNAVEGYEAV
ncbi:conserved hypothetical protein [uncultured Eubacteriales bacterium]|uniref:Uncharacterized protein n=1 Tax=uncultured Eubacteriales bacterium TaxID=172733 RepID=A0A212JAS0_9FIRM|nr:conserved hypothetical protein [uncultured Eubacteriales bacterium]